MTAPPIAVVVVCRDSADDLAATLPLLCAQLRPADELIVVDNASSDASVAVAQAMAPNATVLELEDNSGFAGGCHVGAGASSAPLLLFLNPDAAPRPGCLDALRSAAAAHPRWGAWQALVTMPDGTTVNSAGNVVHYLGIGWAGRCGAPVAAIDATAEEVGFASGAALVVRRAAWEATGGFDARYFMYGEDLDLCLRLRLAGWAVGRVPGAHVTHDYEFEKGDYKWYFLERNRWWTILGVYPASLLALLAPALLAFEVVVLAAAWRGGWLGPKLRAQAAVLRELPAVLRRRRAVQATRTVRTAAFVAGFSALLDSPHLPPAAGARVVRVLQASYWRLVRRALR